MTRQEAQSQWEKIVDKGFYNYATLTRDERVWFNLEPLANGGIIDNYINNGGEHNLDTIQDLNYLGFNDVAQLMMKINKLFKKGYPPTEINERNDEIESWGEKYNLFLDEYENIFWSRSADLEKALVIHINCMTFG